MKLVCSISLAISIPLAGCVSFSNIQSTEELKTSPDEGLVIIGAPDGAKVVVHSGTLEAGKFVADGWLPDGIIGASENGFLIRKLRALKPDKGYALVSVTTDRTYSASCGQRMVVFTVNSGEVQYITTFTFKAFGDKINVGNVSDLPAAATYMKEKFPNFAGEVTQAHVEMAQQGRCLNPGGITYIPIHIPRSR